MTQGAGEKRDTKEPNEERHGPQITYYILQPQGCSGKKRWQEDQICGRSEPGGKKEREKSSSLYLAFLGTDFVFTSSQRQDMAEILINSL